MMSNSSLAVFNRGNPSGLADRIGSQPRSQAPKDPHDQPAPCEVGTFTGHNRRLCRGHGHTQNVFRPSTFECTPRDSRTSNCCNVWGPCASEVVTTELVRTLKPITPERHPARLALVPRPHLGVRYRRWRWDRRRAGGVRRRNDGWGMAPETLLAQVRARRLPVAQLGWRSAGYWSRWKWSLRRLAVLHRSQRTIWPCHLGGRESNNRASGDGKLTLLVLIVGQRFSDCGIRP
jgi:hypothetical protein